MTDRPAADDTAAQPEGDAATAGAPELVPAEQAPAAVKLLLPSYAGRHYGFFVDELYYLDCAQHLAWGYVDQPPLIALVAKIARTLFDHSLSGIRLPAALAGHAT